MSASRGPQPGSDSKSNANGSLSSLLAGLSRSWRRDADVLSEACRVFDVRTVGELQDFLNSLVLAECVYKIVDHGSEGAAQQLSQLKDGFPAGLISLKAVQWALPHVQHRYLLAEGPDALYVAFMGTKERRDMFTNANVLQEVVWQDLREVSSAEVHVGAPAAHRGFLRRARTIPIEALYKHAHRKGKKLVMCGHSLGGAVATLCTVRLLQTLPPAQRANVKCIGFATPPVGNACLSRLVRDAGWQHRIHNFMLPEDVIPRILTFSRPLPSHGAISYVPQLAASGSSPVGGSTVVLPQLLEGEGLPSSGADAVEPAEHGGPANSGLPKRLPVASVSTAIGPPYTEKLLGSVAGQSRAKTATSAGISGSRFSFLPSSLVPTVLRRNIVEGNTERAPSTSTPINNIVSAPKKLVRRVAESRQQQMPEQETAAGAAEPGDQTDDKRRTLARGASVGQWQAVARSATQFVSTPVRAARAYVPVGRQLFVLPHNVSRQLPSDGDALEALSPQETAALATAGDEEEPRTLSGASASTSGGSAAAGSSAVALSPEEQKKRVLFHMHRMSSYRGRVTAILLDAIGRSAGEAGGGAAAAARLLRGGGRRPSDVLLTTALAPAMKPFSALGFIAANLPQPQPTEVAAASAAPPPPLGLVPRQLIPLTGGASTQQSARGRWVLPWAQFFARGGGSNAKAADVELVLRISGGGLDNCTKVHLDTGDGNVVRGEIVSRPSTAQLLLTSLAPRPLHWSPLRLLLGGALEAWALAQAWVGRDPLLVRVALPAPMLAEIAAENVRNARSGGGSRRLAVRLVSDFQVVELPLKLENRLTREERQAAESRFKDIFFAAAKL